MKKVFVVTLVLGLFAGYAQALDKIEASALSTIESFAVYADKGQFSALENVFAELFIRFTVFLIHMFVTKCRNSQLILFIAYLIAYEKYCE